MKSLAAWLLVLFALLVPATAAVMAPVFSPSVSATKQAQLRTQTHQTKDQTEHAVAKSPAHATPLGKADTHRKSADHDAHTENCSDCGPCNLCSACGPASSIVSAYDGPLLPGNAADTLVPERMDGRPQFISSGQYRPPRFA